MIKQLKYPTITLFFTILAAATPVTAEQNNSREIVTGETYSNAELASLLQENGMIKPLVLATAEVWCQTPTVCIQPLEYMFITNPDNTSWTMIQHNSAKDENKIFASGNYFEQYMGRLNALKVLQKPNIDCLNSGVLPSGPLDTIFVGLNNEGELVYILTSTPTNQAEQQRGPSGVIIKRLPSEVCQRIKIGSIMTQNYVSMGIIGNPSMLTKTP